MRPRTEARLVHCLGQWAQRFRCRMHVLTDATASSGVSGGRIPGNRSASIDFPLP